jgi:hypothetical protein
MSGPGLGVAVVGAGTAAHQARCSLDQVAGPGALPALPSLAASGGTCVEVG